MRERPRVYVDMDGVLVDFESAIPRLPPGVAEEFQGRLDEVPGIFALMDPMPGAIRAFGELADLFDVYILSTAPWDNPSAWSDKVQWVHRHLGGDEGSPAHKRLILSHHKDLLVGDVIIDDRTARGVDRFAGEHVHFGTEEFPDWPTVVAHLRGRLASDPAPVHRAAEEPLFLGVDLAWSDRARTGLAAVDASGALIDSTSVRSDEEIDRWLDACGPVVVAAIDAPLVVRNESGSRPCERELTRDFGAFHAGCHPANRSRPWFDPPRGAVLADRRGWHLDQDVPGTVDRPTCIEVYPHPAMVSLFGLDRVLPYKGRSGRSVDSRRAAFGGLVRHLEGIEVLRLPASDRWGQLRAAVDGATRPTHLERIEDEVDAILCAHLAWLWHRDPGAMRIYGDVRTGCIVTPPPPARR